MNIPTLLTVRQFSQKHTAFPEGGLRHYIFYSDQNGMAEYGAILRNGRKILLDEEKFFHWVVDRGGRTS
jgi:hypothetical protein